MDKIPDIVSEKKKITEHSYVFKDLKREGKEGWCSIQKFGGQTHVYIRNDIFNRIGKEKIVQLVEQIYTKEVLEKFSGLQINYENSVMFELPPQNDSKDKRAEQLITEIENFE